MKELIIIGASGFGKEVAWLVERINEITPVWNILGYLDDNSDIQGNVINGYEVIGSIRDIEKYGDVYLACAVGASNTRAKVVKKIKSINSKVKFATLIDPSFEMSDTVEIGEGTIICAHNLATVNVSIGKFAVINVGCIIGHNAVIEDYVTLCPSINVSGNVVCEKYVEIGVGTQILPGKTIGEGTIVGAGAVVNKDLPANCTAVGIPAKPIKFHD